MKLTPLREFVIKAMLFLPLAFALWFALNSVVAYPVARATVPIVEWLVPGMVNEAAQDYFRIGFSYIANVGNVPGLPGSRLLVDQQALNVLIYAYCIPLFFGLVAATPLNWRNTFLQWGVGSFVMFLSITAGAVAGMLFMMMFGVENAVIAALREEGFAAVAQQAGAAAAMDVTQRMSEHGLGPNAVGLLYQFTYLILPPVVPIVTWIMLNRNFLESLVGWEDGGFVEAAEPAHPEATSQRSDNPETSA